jgi:hypothetical protein
MRKTVYAAAMILAVSGSLRASGDYFCESVLTPRSKVTGRSTRGRDTFMLSRVEDLQWARTIFGDAVIREYPDGSRYLDGDLTTVLEGNKFSVFLNGRRFSYFDFAHGRALSDLATVTLATNGGIAFEFRYSYTGNRRRLELWVTGLTGDPAKKVLSSRSGMEILL